MSAIKDVPGLDGLVREHVYAHVFDNADREVGGVLVGRISAQGAIPLVTAAIAAASASERRSTLTFTQDTWEHVHRVLESEHPRDQIVGWYHSHPGFGIFLSEEDLFIHRNFFSGTSQIALVVDPLHGTEGVFGWQDDTVVQWYERATARPGLGVPATPLNAYEIVPSPTVGGPPLRTAIVMDGPPPLARAPGAAPVALLCALVLGVLTGFALWEGVLRGDGARPVTESNEIVEPQQPAVPVPENEADEPPTRGPG